MTDLIVLGVLSVIFAIVFCFEMIAVGRLDSGFHYYNCIMFLIIQTIPIAFLWWTTFWTFVEYLK